METTLHAATISRPVPAVLQSREHMW